MPSVRILFDIVLYVDDRQNALQLDCRASCPKVFRTIAGDDRTRSYQKALCLLREWHRRS
jgi:hypothetical protein